MPEDEERVIRGDMLKSNGREIVSKALVPGTRHLLYTIKRFPQAAHIIWVMKIMETQ